MSKKLFNQKATWEEAQELPKEQAVRGIINTSIEDGKHALKKCDDLIVLEETLRREEEGAKRSGMLKPLKTKIAKLRKSEGRLEITVDNNPEVLANDPWRNAKDYLSGAKRFARASVACQVMLGFELSALKKKLGFTHGGQNKKKKQADNLSTCFKNWGDLCQAELGISDRTARRFENMAEGAKRKLKSCFQNLPLLKKPVTEYTDEELNLLEKAVEKVTDGQTQAELLQEWQLAKKPQGSAATGGDIRKKSSDAEEESDESEEADNEEESEEEDVGYEQLAFAFITPAFSRITEMRLSKDYAHYLHALPVVGDHEQNKPGLSDIKTQLESMLSEIDEVIASKKNSALATA